MPTDYRHTDTHLRLVMVVVAHSWTRQRGYVDNIADMVDRLLIFILIGKASRIKFSLFFVKDLSEVVCSLFMLNLH